MGANRYMVDSGGVTRHIKKRYVIDSGGVARLIVKRYIVDASGVTRLTYLALQVIPLTISNTHIAPALAEVSFHSDGTEGQITKTLPYTAVGNWGPGGGGYSIRATLLSGTAPNAGPADPLGTWLTLDTNRTWGLQVTGASTSKTCALLIEIGITGSGTALASGQIILETTTV
ncbi:MAG TPA: hypothetical protein VI653_28475 [Steroidobacteraceae bacterium]